MLNNDGKTLTGVSTRQKQSEVFTLPCSMLATGLFFKYSIPSYMYDDD